MPPKRSPQEEITRLTKDDGVGIQKLTTLAENHKIDGCHRLGEVYDIYSKNDGLSKEDFFEWFRGVKINTDMAIIHFTNYRY